MTIDTIYRYLVQGVTDYAIYMLASDGTVSNWNAGAERAKGYKAEEIVGRHFSTFYTEEDRKKGLPEKALATALADGKFEGEGWRIRKDGTRLWAHVIIDQIFDDAGVMIGFAKITRDMTHQREAQLKAQEQERNFRLLVQGVTDYAIYMLDPDGRVSNWNAGAERAKGYKAEEIVGSHFSRFYTEQDKRKGKPQRALATALAKGKFEGEGWRIKKDGGRFWAHVIIDPIRDENGILVGFAKITRDLTEFKQQMDQMAHIKSNLDLALANMSQGLCLFDEREQLVLSNDRFEEILGLEPDAIKPGATLVDVLWTMHADPEVDYNLTAEKVRREREAFLATIGNEGKIVSSEQVWRGRSIAMNHRSLPGGGWVSTIDDVTERKKIEDRIVHMAHYDALTELPNRASFRNDIDDALKAAKPCALLYLDLDRFKPINDTLGHSVGDEVLQVVANRLASQLRETEIGARLGGDEFAVLLVGHSDVKKATAAADRLIREITRSFRVNEMELTVGVSIGMAFAPQNGTDAETLLRNADLALYAAKNDGRGCHRCYEAGMEQLIQDRLDLEADLRNALEKNEFSLHYQPIVDTAHNQVTCFEALLRWESPNRGKVSPADFIPLAEETGLMPKIGEWVLRTACAEAMKWPDSIQVAVNLSPTQFRSANLVEVVLEVLESTGLPAHRLELEITETSMISDIRGARKVLDQLRSHGVQVALDDFGTGYSSLSFLRDLPFTRIKIDRSFVKDLGHKPEARAIIRAVAGLCSSLGVATTAEGVETHHQLKLLIEEGCQHIQGFLINRPSSGAEALAWLEAYRSEHEGKLRIVARTA